MGLVAKAFQDIITFSRASSGTYTNSNGYITNSSVLNYLTYSNQPENAAWTKSNSFVQQNLLLYSEDFTNVNWSTVNVAAPTANTTIAPDGTLTADTLTASAGLNTHNINQSTSVSLTPVTFSIYLKAGTHGFVQLFHGANSAYYANFNLSTGVLGTVGGSASATITAAANGFYRCTLTVTPSAASALRIAFVSSSTAVYNESWTAAGTETFFAWGAQFVQGSVPGDYRATTSAALPCLYADYNGALRARKLSESTATAPHYAYQGVYPAATYTISCYAKQGERTRFGLGNVNSGNYAYFNLATGVVTNAGTGDVSGGTMISLGNGWYRCYAVCAATTSWSMGIITTDAAGNITYAGDGSSGIYIADAQLNDGSSALAYYDTTASAYNAPRFDYDPVTLAAKGLLVEESRANLLTYSGDFASAAWTKNSSTLTSNAAISPDGTVTADKLISNVGVFGTASQAPTVVVSTTYTYSIYAKAAEFSWLRFQVNLITGTRVAWFNLASGAVGTVQAGLTASIVSAGNGFYRCIVAAIADNTNGSFLPGATNADNSATNGDGVSGIYIWGAQCEAGAFATSYIPTVASQVTRAADVASVNTLSPWFNSVAGTLFVQALRAAVNPSAAPVAFEIGDGTNNNRYLIYNPSAGITSEFFVSNGGVAQAQINVASAFQANVVGKVAGAYQVNDFQQASNGTLGTADTSGTLPTVTAAYIGRNGTGTVLWNGWIQRITYYPRRLTNAELQTLTTL